MKMLTSCLTVLVGMICLSDAATAKGPRYTDPTQADADFAIQGEYAGTVKTEDGEEGVGIQVIALGQGKFRAVGHPGGLPGDGWKKEAGKIEAESENKDGALVFTCDKGSVTLKDGAITISTPDGKPIGTAKKVTRKSPTLGAKPPAGAVVLFDGTSVDDWIKGRMTEDGLLMEGTTSGPRFGSHKLHIEFRLPYQPEDRGQGRGNSGIYAQGRYEIQMLDSFGLAGKHNECGGIYSVSDPDVNMCYPPLAWQTYDIDYTAAKFDGEGKLVVSPRVTVHHNGVLVHDDLELPGERSTTAAPSKPGPEPGPVYLQNHGCPVRYRNIWVVEN